MRSPRYSDLEVTLAALRTVWGEPRVLLWQVHSRELQFVDALQSRQSDFAAALAMWHKGWRRIERGDVVKDAHASYYPVCTPAGVLVGLVQAAGNRTVQAHGQAVSDYVNWLLGTLASALITPLDEFADDDPTTNAAQADESTSSSGAPSPAVIVSATADDDEVQRAKLLAALEANEWNAAATAAALGVARQTVWRRRKRLSIERPELSPFDPRSAIARRAATENS